MVWQQTSTYISALNVFKSILNFQTSILIRSIEIIGFNVMIKNIVYGSLFIQHNSNEYTNVDTHVSKFHP